MNAEYEAKKIKREFYEFIVRASDEVRTLRRQNDIYSAKVEVLDMFGRLVRALIPLQGGAMHPDVLWQMEKRMRELEAERAAEEAHPLREAADAAE